MKELHDPLIPLGACDSHGTRSSGVDNAKEYKSRSRIRAEAWAKLGALCHRNVVQSEAAHLSSNRTMCVRRKDSSALVRCDDCGGNGLYCSLCAEKSHSDIN